MNSNSQHKLLAVGAMLLFIAILIIVAIAPFWYTAKIANEISASRPLLENLKAHATRITELKSENKRLSEAVESSNLLLVGDTTGLAGANLQKRVVNLVKTKKGQARSFQILPPKPDDNLVRISMSLTINVTTESLRDILYELETKTPLLFVDRLVIRMAQRPRRRRTRQPSPVSQTDLLSVNLQVSGYVTKDKTS